MQFMYSNRHCCVTDWMQLRYHRASAELGTASRKGGNQFGIQLRSLGSKLCSLSSAQGSINYLVVRLVLLVAKQLKRLTMQI